MLPELNKIYTIRELHRNWSVAIFENAWTYFHSFYLPTEVVICEPTYSVPKVARCWNTPWFDIDGKLLPTLEVQSMPEHANLAKEKHVFCIEMWSDHGDYGSLSYQMDGYAFFSAVGVEILQPKALLAKMKDIEYLELAQRNPDDKNPNNSL